MKVLITATFVAATISAMGLFAAGVDERTLPQSKRTSLGLYVTAEEAYRQWQADRKGVKLIDVRTPEEFRLIGCPKTASKVPLSTPREFAARVRAIAAPGDTVLVICRSGNRSAMAVNWLAQAGYKKAYSVVDGFEGDRNTDRSSPDFGRRTVNGWKNAGLPWER